MGLIARLLRAIKALETASSLIAGGALLAIMFVICIDVAGRYLLNSPLAWSYDLISLYLMGVGFFFALSDTLRRNHHVNVDILYNRLSRRLQIFWNAIGWSSAAVLFSIILVLTARETYRRWSGGNVLDGAIAWPTWISAAVATVGIFLMTARLVVGGVAFAVAFVTGNPRLCEGTMDQHDDAELAL